MRTGWFGLVALSLYGCVSEVPTEGTAATVEQSIGADAGDDAGIPACVFGAPLVHYEDDCVALAQSACSCGLAQYRCSVPGYYSENTPLSATAGPDGTACSSQVECVRNRSRDTVCPPNDPTSAIPLGQAFSCPQIDGGGFPLINSLGDCHPWDGGAPDGEAPIFCCP